MSMWAHGSYASLSHEVKAPMRASAHEFLSRDPRKAWLHAHRGRSETSRLRPDDQVREVESAEGELSVARQNAPDAVAQLAHLDIAERASLFRRRSSFVARPIGQGARQRSWLCARRLLLQICLVPQLPWLVADRRRRRWKAMRRRHHDVEQRMQVFGRRPCRRGAPRCGRSRAGSGQRRAPGGGRHRPRHDYRQRGALSRPSCSSSAPSPSTRRSTGPTIQGCHLAQQAGHPLPGPPAATARPSRFSSAPSPSTRRRSAPSTLSSPAGSATWPAYWATDRHREAEPLFARALAILEGKATAGPPALAAAARTTLVSSTHSAATRRPTRHGSTTPGRRPWTVDGGYGEKDGGPTHPSTGRDMHQVSRSG